MNESIISPITFVILMIALIHLPLVIIMIPLWISNQFFGNENKDNERLDRIAQEIGIQNRSLPAQKGLFFFSWMVYQKKVRDYYKQFSNILDPMEGGWIYKVKPGSIPRYFYGALFSNTNISNVLSTDESTNPYILVTEEKVKAGKKKTDYYRLIYYRSNALDLPKCHVIPASGFLDNISPDQDDINFKSDEEFSSNFDLFGENEPKIRTLMTENVRRIMSDKPEWKWVFDNDQLLIKYKLDAHSKSEMDDIKPSLGELAKLHNELKNIDLTQIPSQSEIEKERPEEIITTKLYRKRMASFGCAMGCGTIIFPFGLFMLYGFFSTFNIGMLGPFFIFAVPGFFLFKWGWSEWKRNKQLKADGKIQDN